ncbi:MAG: CRISPR-associated protein Cas4 [Bacteroidetes bacterium]|nr:CRISPR-associated protein Cas4 [Bacteroidota bacterium]MBU1423662.1 CRISPR-associated protein Cas4 [Bacteroidota bacterium]MBU2447584.1 CRISPR-associated protein Cas4 [Bacteroidota bacterium]MBU2635718.1 CRISPR-associated protein Cas4 [Bacteroidota bacterium]
MQITGTHLNYYYVCKRELWLFSRGLQMEHTSDLVYIGKVIDENSYAREEKGIDIDGVINIDWIDTKTGVIHEVKKSDSVEKAHEMQVLYYIWYLKQKGVEGITGEIDYPVLKQKTKVELTIEKEAELLKALEEIEQIVALHEPPPRINKRFCKTCSYFELCWVE